MIEWSRSSILAGPEGVTIQYETPYANSTGMTHVEVTAPTLREALEAMIVKFYDMQKDCLARLKEAGVVVHVEGDNSIPVEEQPS